MTSTNSLSLILRRLDEVESKLDRIVEELRTLNTPAAIGYSVRRGNNEPQGTPLRRLSPPSWPARQDACIKNLKAETWATS